MFLLKSIVMISSHLHLGFPNVLFPLGFLATTLYGFLTLTSVTRGSPIRVL